MPEFVKVAKTADIPPGEVRGVDLKGTRVAIANVDGTFYAIFNECPHMGGPLDEGFLEGKTLMCPWHAADFDLETGAALHPPATGSIPVYKVRVTGDDIEVEAPEKP